MPLKNTDQPREEEPKTYTCKCGSIVYKSKRSIHLLTNKHLKYLKIELSDTDRIVYYNY